MKMGVTFAEPHPYYREKELERHVLAVRLGHGANCSSIGSVIDTLFVTAVVGSAIFAAVLAAMKREEVRVHDEDQP
jgi:hypothetical protein